MECILCIKQYVGMAEISFNVSKAGIISTNEESLPLSISYQILPNVKKISPSGLWKEKTFGFYHHMCYTQKVPTWTVLNNINNKYNRKHWSCIILCKICFSLVQLVPTILKKVYDVIFSL